MRDWMIVQFSIPIFMYQFSIPINHQINYQFEEKKLQNLVLVSFFFLFFETSTQKIKIGGKHKIWSKSLLS